MDVAASTSANSLAAGQSPQISSLFGATTNCVINVNFAPSNTAVMYKKGLNMNFGFVAMLVYICVSLFCCVFAGAVHVPCTPCKRSEEGIDSL